MKLRAWMALFLLCFVGGCQSLGFVGGESSAAKHHAKQGLHMSLFYDRTTTTVANDHYLDALLDIVDQYPETKRDVTVHTDKTHQLKRKYQLDKQPALIVSYNGKTLKCIKGNNDKSQIVKKVSKVIDATNVRQQAKAAHHS